ncbi:MAG: hypothetical protein KatS3mg005_1529 [Bryobacteraceae bacterium]|nr:MAG: hypothetical protein KatS3mg005_1529 [Bryobacteraceae bacterium]
MPEKGQRWGRIAAATVLPLLLAGLHWELLAGPRAVWFASEDNAYQVLPWLEVQARAWRAGELPLWDPYQWMGQPLPGQGQPAVASPLNWLLGLKPEGAGGWLFLNVYFLLIRWIGAAGMYRLARALGAGRTASALAGVAYAEAGAFAAAMRPQMAMGAMWAPWALRHLLRAMEAAGGTGGSVRQAALGGFFLGLCWLGGHHQTPLFVSLGFGLAWVIALSENWRKIAAAGVFFAMAAMTAAVQMLPMLEYGRRAVRWVGAEAPIRWREKIPLDIHQQFSLKWESIPAIFVPGYGGKFDAYHGALLLGLAAAGALLLPRRRAALALAAGGVTGAWLALGPAGGLHRVLYATVPHFDKARAPEAALILLSLGVPALAAAGAEALFRRELKGRGGWAVFWMVIAAAAGVSAWRGGPGVWTAGGALALGLLVWLGGWRRVPAWSAALLAAGAVVAEMQPMRERLMPRIDSPEAARYVGMLSAHGGIAQWLRAQGGQWRAEVDDSAVPYNFGDWHGEQQHQGYLASVTENIYRHELHTEHAQRLFGVRWRVAQTPSAGHPKEVFAGADGLRVYEAEGVLPRAFIVHEAFGIDNRAHAAGELYRIREEMAVKTFLPGPVPELERCGGGEEARIAEYGLNRVVVEARLACKGMVILTDTWFPGWRARVDGRPARIHEAYAAVRGVVVEGGAHRVEFVYRPGSAMAGGALTALACLAAAVCARRRTLH